MSEYTRNWLHAAVIRALKTVAQAALGAIGSAPVALGEVNWLYVCSVALMSGVISLLMSTKGLPEVSKE